LLDFGGPNSFFSLAPFPLKKDRGERAIPFVRNDHSVFFYPPDPLQPVDVSFDIFGIKAAVSPIFFFKTAFRQDCAGCYVQDLVRERSHIF